MDNQSGNARQVNTELLSLTSGTSGYEWQPDFLDRVKVRAGHNKWFCAKLDGDTTGDIPDNTAELLSQFLREEQDWDSNLYQAVPIRRVCSSAELAILNADVEGHLVRRRTSLLDERVEADAQLGLPSSCRRNVNDETMSAYTLYKALRKKRYKVPTVRNTAEPGRDTPIHEPDDGESDADRRLVYITDPDCWNLLAIIATASPLEGDFLRDFIYRHIEFKTHIGVRVPAGYLPLHTFTTQISKALPGLTWVQLRGAKRFALEFHLPFYVCKQGTHLIQDDRIKTNDKPLRRTGDLKFLKLAPGPALVEEEEYFDCIYEVQISVLVTGVDHWSWTAFAFVDTYYKRAGNEGFSSDLEANSSEDESLWNQESVDFYHEQYKRFKDFANLDPLTGGQNNAEPPTWRPREYFLEVLRSRVKQVNREWHNTVFRVLQRIEPHTHDDLLADPDGHQGHAHAQVLDKRSQIFFDKGIRLLQQMSNLLTLTLDAWARFMDKEIKYFSNLERPSDPSRQLEPPPNLLIVEINREIEDLRALRRSLDQQKEHLNALLQKLEKGLQLDNNEIAALQQRNATLITALTISASFLGLISTTAAIFSMQDGVPAGNIIATVFSLLIGLLVIFAQVFKSQLKEYMQSKEWRYGSIWTRRRSSKSRDIERDIPLHIIQDQSSNI